jgi:FkbM family methyltransferase
MFLVDKRLGNYTRLDPEGILTVSETNRYWISGIPEEAQINWMCVTFGSATAAALDIGAHCGTWTVSLSKVFKKVYSFEPNPTVYNVLCANLALRGQQNVFTSRKALSSAQGVAKYFFRSDDGGGNGIENLNPIIDSQVPSCTVKTATLDQWVCGERESLPIKFIKIDVEGHELDVLRGAVQTIERFKPAIVLESWHEFREQDGIPAKALQEALFNFVQNDLGYDMRPINGHFEMFLCTPQICKIG